MSINCLSLLSEKLFKGTLLINAMTIYCISYDLIAKKDYKTLIEKIQSYGAWAHAEESLWFIESEKTAAEIRDELKSLMDNDDKIIVIRVTLPWASLNLSKAVADWLKGKNF